MSTPAMGKKKEHELTTLKRIGGAALRMSEATGTKVMHVYDPAVIDYQQWHKWKQGRGVYILTLEKKNSALHVVGESKWDKGDERNTGVLSDEIVGPSNGRSMRRVRYQDPVTGTVYCYLTTETTLPPGLIAFLYKLRWDVEKVFDQVKNGFREQKAWGRSPQAKCQQARFITLAHNLTLNLERLLEAEEGIADEKVIAKAEKRLANDKKTAAMAGRKFNPLVAHCRRITQRSAQFLRWLRACLEHSTCWKQAVEKLRPLMLKYLV